MRVVFRVDSSLEIGTGHVMRCLTLGEYLRNNGVDVSFICRKHSGNLISKVISKGFHIFELELLDSPINDHTLFHSHWLGVTQQQDAEQSKDILKKLKPDWLVVDHYALDHEWESELKNLSNKLMVIDDLADRKHNCDMLLDQTFGRNEEHYKELVPKSCEVLIGAEYSLLRPDFSTWRPYSLKKRINPTFKTLLIALGGVDAENHTEDILIRLMNCTLPKDIKVTIVLGRLAPHLQGVKTRVKKLNYEAEIKVDIENMAEVMANSDLAIGAAGSSTWERCCMGLPTIQVILAKNQVFLAESLAKIDAAVIIDEPNTLESLINNSFSWMHHVSISSSKITDGTGACKVGDQMTKGMVKVRLEEFGEVNLINYVNMNRYEQSYVLKMRNEHSVKRWMYSQQDISDQEHYNFIQKLNTNREALYFLVKFKSTIVGSINFSNILANDSVHFGLFTNPFADLKGAGRILEAAGMEYAHSVLGIERLKLEVFSDNIRAINFYKKCGFRLVGLDDFKEKKVLLMEKLRDIGNYGD